jgi:hypothetical protein
VSWIEFADIARQDKWFNNLPPNRKWAWLVVLSQVDRNKDIYSLVMGSINWPRIAERDGSTEQDIIGVLTSAENEGRIRLVNKLLGLYSVNDPICRFLVI